MCKCPRKRGIGRSVFVLLEGERDRDKKRKERKEREKKIEEIFLSRLHFLLSLPLLSSPLVTFLSFFFISIDALPSFSSFSRAPQARQKEIVHLMRSGALLGGGGRLSAPSSSSSFDSLSMAPTTHAPARRGYAAARASGARSARVVAAAGQTSSVRTALRARGSSLPSALRAGRAPVKSTSSASRRPSSLVVKAVFERFTERAIKAVMLSQTEAKNLGSSEVRDLCFFGRGVGRGNKRANAESAS